MPKKESDYQRNLIKRIEKKFPGCEVIKNDPQHQQGILDLLVLFYKGWAMLEVKRSSNEPFQPNQPYYIDKYNNMSFAAVIYPENEESVLNDLQSAFER